MDIINIRDARTRLHGLINGWRADDGKPVYVGPYGGAAEAVITPVAVWSRLVAAVAASWDAWTAAERAERLADPAGPQPSTLRALATIAGCDPLPIPILQSRGVPRGAADLAVWGPAAEELRGLSDGSGPETAVVAIKAIGDLLTGRATTVESHCGHGAVYVVAEVDGLHAAVVTARRVPRSGNSRRGGRGTTVELIGVDCITW